MGVGVVTVKLKFLKLRKFCESRKSSLLHPTQTHPINHKGDERKIGYDTLNNYITF